MQKELDLREIEMDLGGLALLGRLRISRASDPMPMQAHENQFEILYMHSGRKVFFIEGRKYILNGGDVLLTFPGERHGADDVTQNRTMMYYLLFEDPENTPGFCGLETGERKDLAALLRGIRQRSFAVSSGLKKRFDQLIELETGSCAIRATRTKYLALELIWQVVTEACAGCHDMPDDIGRIAEYIRSNYSKTCSVSELADMVHLSVPRFKQKFKQVTGVPPAEYIIREKIARSEAMLIESSTSITDIALDIGFSSSQHFSVVFKKYNGESPQSFRRNNQAAAPAKA